MAIEIPVEGIPKIGFRFHKSPFHSCHHLPVTDWFAKYVREVGADCVGLTTRELKSPGKDGCIGPEGESYKGQSTHKVSRREIKGSML